MKLGRRDGLSEKIQTNLTTTPWDWKKTVTVEWPREFSKLHKKIIKNSIDPSSIATTSCVAQILQFSGESVSVA